MTNRRLLKAAEAIREVVSMAILTEMRDPRVKNVTVIGVEVAPDMKSAKVNVSIMGDETQERLTLNTLQSAAGFLQHKIAKEIDTRYTPRLEFVIDKGVKNSLEIARILAEVLPPKPAADTLPLHQDEEDEDDEADVDDEGGEADAAGDSSDADGGDGGGQSES